MDGVGKDTKGVLILGATNIPWQLDGAIRRRFQRRVHINLPDMQARMRMFEICVGTTPCELKQSDYKNLAQLSEGYSGSDISIAVQDALMQPVRKIQTATHYKKVGCHTFSLRCPTLWTVVRFIHSATLIANRYLSMENRRSRPVRLVIAAPWKWRGLKLSRSNCRNHPFKSRTSSRPSRLRGRLSAK